jgi:hypothetical protein
MAIAHAQEAPAARGTRAYCLLPHYLTEVSQQGLAAHVEAVYRSVSLGENSQLAKAASASGPQLFSSMARLATGGKAGKWTVFAICSERSCIEQCSPLLARNSGQSQRMIPAMVILGELSDIFGDAQRGVWLEIWFRLRASSKLFSRHFLDRTRAF